MTPLPSPPFLFLPDKAAEAHGPWHGPWLCFRRPLEILSATSMSEVLPHLERAAEATARGLWAAGFLTYEAAPAFDHHLAAHPSREGLPLAWWGLFEEPERVWLPSPGHQTPRSEWSPSLTATEYAAAVNTIHGHIAAGDTYQVNFTFPLRSDLEANPFDLFLSLQQSQRAGHGAYVDLGQRVLCSASPELFFTLDGELLRTRPMKGTAPRGRNLAEDSQQIALLAASAKDRAENVMIVDMMRNDLGRIAKPGSVRVDSLFDIETYPTVHQMTSTVRAESPAGLPEIFSALFPCASITGAPKVRTMEIIRQLETAPRGIYTGTIGWIGPHRQASFNVAIRTLDLQQQKEPQSSRPPRWLATYGTGGGIVSDSKAATEYQECRTKALVLTVPLPEFQLLETLLWRPDHGFFLLERHLDRLRSSAAYFDFRLREDDLRGKLSDLTESLPPERHRVRLLVGRDGNALEATPMPRGSKVRWSLCLDNQPISSADPFLFHKTTYRKVYQEALNRHPDFDEVLLWNESGQLTESTRANLALEIGGQWWTPPVTCGLLAGTYRAELLDRGRLRERILTVNDLAQATRIRLFNALRGWIRPNFHRPEI